ncbi:hypothetical protein [Thermococcus piezophilus]|uniref:Uncharacterized protein n=1 Tax=Thermococcus piezophilus TaxID=1712654 RepID=A0A172WGW5_9EURY|nr:hypothetical protein [Thermococcus piezophilus]ANF22687.1 hypothetical protein A7C91_05500 [Thermococcus piezophilus]
MRRGYLLNVTALLLVIPLLLLVATYQQASSYIIASQSQRTLVERQYFGINNIQYDLQNIVELSFKRAYLTLTEYVINYDFVDNASLELKNLMVYGTLKGMPQKNMDNLTLRDWFKNTVSYLNSIGFNVEPSDPDEFVRDHLEVTVGPLDSFHVAVRVKIKNITITESSGVVRYSGDIPPGNDKYLYSVVSIVGFEDPFIVRMLNGLYTRVITPCKIPFPGEVYGYYNISSQDDVDELVLNWCYLGLQDNESAGMYYPTILERFEGKIDMNQHEYYLSLAKKFQEHLGFTRNFPVGIVTFLVPDPNVDPALLGALTSVGSFVPDNYTSVSYYFLRCAIDGEDCREGVSIRYDAFKLDTITKSLVFGNG